MAWRRSVSWMLGVCVVAFALRVYRLDAQSLWWDELFGIAIGQQPFPDWLLLVLDNRGNPPGIYFLETLWTKIGADAFTVRFMSVWFGVLAVALMFRVAKLLGGVRAGLVAAALLAISPHHLWYSQEARMYAPQIFCALAASFFFIRILRRPTWRDTLGYALASAAIVYLHYHPFFLLAQLVFLIWFRRLYPRVLAYWLAGAMLAGLLYMPWVWAVFTTGGLERAPMGWVPATQWYDPFLSLYVFWLGAANDPGAWLNWVGFIAVSVLAIGGMMVRLRAPHQAASARAETYYVLIWLILPILMVWAISLDLPLAQKRSAYVDRYLSPEFPAWLIVIALGATQLFQSQRRGLALGAAVAVVPLALAIAQMYTDPFVARDNWKAVAALVRAERDMARAVLVAREDQQLPMLYYGLSDYAIEVVRRAPGESESAWVEALLRRQGSAQRVWLFSGTIPSNVHRFGATPAQQHANAQRDTLKQEFDARLKIEQTILYQGIYVTIYGIP